MILSGFVDEKRVLRQFEGLCAMGLQGEGLPDSMDAGTAQSAGLGKGTRRPVRGVARSRLQRQSQHTLDITVTQFARRARPRFVEQTIQSFDEKALTPLAHCLFCDAQFRRHFGVRAACRTEQNHAGSQGQCLGRFRPPAPVLKCFALVLSHHKSRCWTSGSHLQIL
jgi:hypothetical protein